MANDLSAVEIPIVAKDDTLKPAINTVNRLEREITRLIKATNNNSVSEERYRQTLIKTGRELKAVSQFTGNQAYGAVVKYANAKRRQMEASEQAAAAARKEAMELKQATAEAARAAKAADDNTKSLNRLRASYDAQFATEQKILTLKKALRTEVDNGRMSLAQADAEIIKYRQHLIAMTTAQTAVTKGNSKMGVLFQQTGYQVGDFAVQIQSGTHYMIALGQQATQLVGTFAMLSRSVKWVGIFSVLGIAIPIITAVAGAILRAGESADDAGKKVRTVSDILGDLTKATKDASNEMRLLGSEFKTALELETIDKIDELKAKILEVGDAMAEARRASLVGLGAAGGFLSGSELEKLAAASASATSDEVISKRQEELKLEKEKLETQLVYLQNERDLKLAAEALLEVQRKLDGITEATLDKSESLLEEFRQRSSLAQAYLANGEEGLKQEERLQEAMALVKELQSEKYNFSEAELDVILEQLKATYDLETAVDAAKESIKTAKEEARLLADALRAATTFSANLDKEVDTLKARLAELKGDAGAMLRLTIQQREEEARSIAARSIAAGEDAIVANARLAIDLAQIQTVKELTEQIETQTESTKRSGKAADEAAKAYERLVAEALKIEESHDPFLKFSNDLKHLNEVFKTGKLFQEAYNKEVGNLQKALGDSIPYVTELSDAFTQFLMSGLKNFGDFVSSIKSMFVKMLSDMIATALRNKIVIPMVAGFTGGTASAASAAASSGSSIIGSATGLSAFAGSVGTGLSASLGTGGFASAGLFNVGANAAAATATGAGAIGATIGAAIPVVAALALAISFFSKKVKELDNGLMVTATNLDATVQSFSKLETTRFWGLSKKVNTEISEVSSKVSSPVVEAVKDIQKSVIDAADAFGISSSVFDDFVYNLKISLKGLTEDQKAQKINEELLKMGDAFASLTVHFEDMNELLEATNQRMELQNRLDKLLGNNAAILARQREAELAAMHELNRPLAQAIYSLEDAQTAVTNAFSALRASIDKVVTDLKVKLGVANEAVNRSRSIIGQLESALSGRYVSGSIGNTFARREGALSFLSAGDFSDENKLSEALSVVSEPTEGLFGSFEDYARDFYTTSSIISEAKKVAETQLTADEQQVALLEQQIADAENQYQVMVDQYNALVGIDTSVKGVAEAIGSLSVALSALASAQSAAKAAAGASAGPTDNLVRQASSAGQKLIDQFGKSGMVTREKDQVKLTRVSLRGENQLLSAAQSLGINTSGKTGAEIQRALTVMGKVAISLDNKTRDKQFAMGGYHTGGMRLVGERGPELEATGPARIFSHNQTSGMFKDPDLKEAVRDLKEEVAGLRSEQRQIQMDISKYTKRSYDIERKWDVEGIPATRT